MGIPTTITVTYSGLMDRQFKVQFSHVWRELEYGQWEYKQLKKVTELCKKGDNVIDVGAWIGMYTLLVSELVGPDGRVVVYEPDPVARAILEKNVEMNHLTNVTISKH